MKSLIVSCLVFVSGAAFAQPKDQPKEPMKEQAKEHKEDHKDAQATAAPAQNGEHQMDMNKMGPWSRKPKNEAAIKKEVAEFFKKMEAAHDMESMNAMNDFPVFMVTDDAQGNVSSEEWSKEKYIAEMKPMMENMPKDSKTKHKPTITVLSDNLVAVTDDFTMTSGKNKMSGKNAGLLVKKNGQWMWKSMVEAGWGGMAGTGGSEMTK